jgi:DNA-directed RNA polymerase subunit RPC12/RpoP
MAKANRSSGESLWESLMMEGQSKADCEFMIGMPSFDSDYAIQKEIKIMENYVCGTCGGKGTMKKSLQVMIPWSPKVRGSFDIAGDQISFRCATCDTPIIVDFLFKRLGTAPPPLPDP